MIATEHRKHPRVKCRVIVDKIGPTIDLSAGGVRVLTANPRPEGSEVRLAFPLPETEEPLQCHGRVVHVVPSEIDGELFEVGIQFQRMMARHREALQQYVQEHVDE